MRILYENLADTATLTVGATAPGMGPEWLKTDIMSEVCRVPFGFATLTANLLGSFAIDTVVLPSLNVSATATVRVRVYGVANRVMGDSGTVLAAPGARLGQPSHVAVYLPQPATGTRVVVDVSDSQQTRLDFPRLVIGRRFEPRYSPSYGASVAFEDSSSHVRTAAGDLRTDRGPINAALSFDLSWIHAADRASVHAILSGGVSRELFIDLLPGNSDAALMRSMRIYGKQDKGGALALISPGLHGTRFNILDWGPVMPVAMPAADPVPSDPNLVLNGNFANALSGWVNASNHWQLAGGRAYHPASTSYLPLSQAVGPATGAILITFDAEVLTASGTAIMYYIDQAGAEQVTVLQTGTNTVSVPGAVGISEVLFCRQAGQSAEFYIDNVSITQT